MIRLLGISLGLVGTTVLGGMGLSYAHDVLYLDPTPIRAEVVAPAPVLSRAAPVLTRSVPAISAHAEPAAVETAPVYEVARLSQSVGAVTSDAVEPNDRAFSRQPLLNEQGAPALSTRPRLRVNDEPVRSAALQSPTPPALRQQRRTPAVQRSAPRTPLVVPVRRATEQKPPRFVIGVYR
jgi:hypothetical protein